MFDDSACRKRADRGGPRSAPRPARTVSSDGGRRWRPSSTAPARPGLSTETNRGTLLGTLMRANSSGPLSGSRTTTARLSESPEMYGKGCAGSTASGVNTGNTCSPEVRPQALPVRLVEVDPAQDLNVLCRQRRFHIGGETLRVARTSAPRCGQRCWPVVRAGSARPGPPPEGRSAAVAGGRRRGPCRTRPGCWRRWQGTWPAPTAVCWCPRRG